ncbi:DNA cytosine methyltransferase [Sphingomonas insulae]|uniref:DNA cytosine methyltransferase n=1 Tax=Sphingomonas insulae TaxID=424800 RepID=UPI002012FF81|nr:DNA cytosine methyltransferase [Sphingomonas insulae]
MASVVDLFCGAGGLAHGFRNEGFSIAAGIDLDPACEYAFEYNNASRFIRRDVDELTANDLCSLYPESGRRVLVGCAPCQPFSTYNQKGRGKAKYALVEKFSRLIAECEPDVVSMENVPKLADFDGGRLLGDFEARLKAKNYHVFRGIVPMVQYGLPQKRNRLVVLASKLGKIELEQPEVLAQARSVRDEIGDLPPLAAGGVDACDPLHRSAKLSELNLRRIRASRPGGSWADWEEDLVADCHRSASGSTYRSVYGRMTWNDPSPTMTTLFYGFGNGRFGHPEQDRALSLREGAMLQSFPRDYEFVRPGDRVNMRSVGRLIGNAVPVALGRVIARSVRRHLAAYPA